MLKAAIAGGALLLGGAYVAGGFGGNGYARTVQRPPAEVMTALADLDITAQPGAPGTDPARAGGVAPLFRLARSADAMTWYVMSGDQVATRMTVRFEPVDGGAATRIHTAVERGDAPDDRVSPAFRSEAITSGLFALAVEGELNKLTAPRTNISREDCERLFMGSMAGARNEGRDLKEAIGATAMTVMKLHATRDRMRQAGCDVDSPPGEFRAVSREMTAADDRPVDSAASGQPAFQPGKPMLDVRR